MSTSTSNNEGKDGANLRRRRRDAAVTVAATGEQPAVAAAEAPVAQPPPSSSEDLSKKKTGLKKQTFVDACFLSIPAPVWWLLFVAWATVLVSVAYVLQTRFGPGRDAPIAPVDSLDPAAEQSIMEIVAELPAPPGNIAVAKSGRIFFTFHPEFHPDPTRVAELVQLKGWGGGEAAGARRRSSFRAFPSASFQGNFTTCMSLRVDRLNRLWALDHGLHGLTAHPKLFVFALSQSEEERDRLQFEYTFPRSVAGVGSFLNDLQIDAQGEWVYIADTSTLAMTPALVVFNSISRTSYRVLSSHPSMFGESWFFSIGPKHRMKLPGPLGFRMHVDSIALDRVNGRWLYYGAMTSDKMYAVSTSDIKAHIATLEKGNLHNITVHLAFDRKPITDGLSTDTMGNIYMTAVDMSAIVVAVAQREPQFDAELDLAPTPPKFNLHKLVQSDSYLRWPDGLSFGPRGLYITSSMLHAKFLGLDLNASAPFHILRVPHTTLQGLQPEAVFAEDATLDFAGQ